MCKSKYCFSRQGSIPYLGPLIWQLNTVSAFKAAIRIWKPNNCPCMLCKTYIGQGCSHWRKRGAGGSCPPLPLQFPNKVQQFQFQASEILLFTGVQKLCGPETSPYLPCMLQVKRLSVISNYIGETDHFTLDLLKWSDT